MKIHIHYEEDEDYIEFYECIGKITISNLLDIFTEPEQLEYISDTAAYKAQGIRKEKENDYKDLRN